VYIFLSISYKPRVFPAVSLANAGTDFEPVWAIQMAFVYTL
jgi:hypothetical protein